MNHSKPTRSLFTILFISSVLTVGLIPNASSQQFTTSTSILTSSLTQTATYYISMFTATTSTGFQTITTSASFELLQRACYIGLISFTATGPTHFAYSANGPMRLYVVDQLTLLAWSSSLLGGQCAPTIGNWVSYTLTSPSYPVTGSFDLSLPTSGNPYGAVFVASTSENPAAILTISPVLVVQTTTATASISVTSTATSATTLAFVTTLKLLFMQTYGSWIAAVIVGALVIATLFFVLRRSRHARK